MCNKKDAITPVLVEMPESITPELIDAIRTDELCKTDDIEEWHKRLGWLICAYDAMIKKRLNR